MVSVGSPLPIPSLCTLQEGREKKKKKDEKERRKGPKREPRAKKHFRGIWKANADGTELPHGLGVWKYDGTHTFYPPKLKDSCYEGTFKAGMRHGPGTCKYKDNGVFEGTFRKEDRHGHGVHTDVNGDRYEGEWHKDARHGVGVFSSPEGERYEGDWVANRREGYGVGVRKDGTKQEGKWSKNLFIEPDSYGQEKKDKSRARLQAKLAKMGLTKVHKARAEAVEARVAAVTTAFAEGVASAKEAYGGDIFDPLTQVIFNKIELLNLKEKLSTLQLARDRRDAAAAVEGDHVEEYAGAKHQRTCHVALHQVIESERELMLATDRTQEATTATKRNTQRAAKLRDRLKRLTREVRNAEKRALAAERKREELEGEVVRTRQRREREIARAIARYHQRKGRAQTPTGGGFGMPGDGASGMMGGSSGFAGQFAGGGGDAPTVTDGSTDDGGSSFRGDW